MCLYNETFFRKIAEALARRNKPRLRLWSAGAGIDYVSLRLKAVYGDAVELTVFDVSEDCIETNRRVFEENGLRADFVAGDLFDIDYSEEFDIVFNTGLLEHYEKEEQEALLRAFSASLRPGGEYLTYVPYAGGRLYNHCMRRMKARGTWELGPEMPISTFKHLDGGGLTLVEEQPLDALHQLMFIRRAYPLLGMICIPVTLALPMMPHFAESILMKSIKGYGLYGRFAKTGELHT